MLRHSVCVSTSTPMTPSHGLKSQRLRKPQRMISGWQFEVKEHYEAEICVCRFSSVFPDTFLGTVQGSATANGLTRGSGEDQKTNGEPSPYTKTHFEADFLCAGTRTHFFDSQPQICRPTLGWDMLSASNSITTIHLPELLRKAYATSKAPLLLILDSAVAGVT